MELDFEKENGLIPAIVQDAVNGEVLMLGFMNREALAKTQETGFVTFYSRSRKKLWMKGESSGQKLLLRELRVDCDQDALHVVQNVLRQSGPPAISAARGKNNEPPETRHPEGKPAGFHGRAIREGRLANFGQLAQLLSGN